MNYEKSWNILNLGTMEEEKNLNFNNLFKTCGP